MVKCTISLEAQVSCPTNTFSHKWHGPCQMFIYKHIKSFHKTMAQAHWYLEFCSKCRNGLANRRVTFLMGWQLTSESCPWSMLARDTLTKGLAQFSQVLSCLVLMMHHQMFHGAMIHIILCWLPQCNTTECFPPWQNALSCLNAFHHYWQPKQLLDKLCILLFQLSLALDT